MISSKGKKIGDVRIGRVPISRVYAGARLVWRRIGLYLKVMPQYLWLPEDVLQGDVDVLSNTEWVANVDAGLPEEPYLRLDASQFNVQAEGGDFEVHVTSNTSWSAEATDGVHTLEVLPPRAQLSPRAGAIARLQVRSSGPWTVR